MKYEYKMVDIPPSVSEAKLNTLGLEGWDVVGVLDKISFIRYVLKRELSRTEMFMAGV